MLSKKTSFHKGFQDVSVALKEYWLPCMLAWQDVSIRYKRSKIGQFWLTLNTLIYIASLGLIFGTLFRFNLHEYLPNICAAILIWNFMTTSITEGCQAFIGAENIILQVDLPFFMHIARTIFRNTIVFGHNIIIFPIISFFVGYEINFYVLLAIPGLIFILINLLWICTILSILCTRYRDLHQVVTSVLQIMFYATPVVWDAKILPTTISPLWVYLNPFYNFIEIVKLPLLGYPPKVSEWLFCGVFSAVGWCLAFCLLGKYKQRIAYWL